MSKTWNQMTGEELIGVYSDTARNAGDRVTALAHMFDRHREGCAHPTSDDTGAGGFDLGDVMEIDPAKVPGVEPGDVVCFHVDGEDWPAIVTKVWSDTCVNLYAFRDQRWGSSTESMETPQQHFTSCCMMPEGTKPYDWTWRFYECPELEG